jgi:hypothetical protein
MKKFLPFLALLFSFLTCIAHKHDEKDTIFRIPQIIYFGIDFTHAILITNSNEERALLQNKLLVQFNNDYYSNNNLQLEVALSKKVIRDSLAIHSLNLKFSDTAINFEDSCIENLLRGYKSMQLHGIGLVYIVEALEKTKSEVRFYAVFFDILSRKVIIKFKETGTSHLKRSNGMVLDYNSFQQATENFYLDYNYISQISLKRSIFNDNGFYFKAIIDEFDIGYEFKTSNGTNFMIEAGYRPRYSNSWHFQGYDQVGEYLTRFLSFGGFTCKMTLNLDISNRSSIGLVLGYQHLYCPKIIWEPENPDGDMYSNKYSIWAQTNDEFLFQVLHFIRFGHPTFPLSFFYGVGIKICTLTENYSIDGTQYLKTPSSRVNNDAAVQPIVTFGLFLKLFHHSK